MHSWTPQKNILSSITHFYAIPNLYDFLFFCETHKESVSIWVLAYKLMQLAEVLWLVMVKNILTFKLFKTFK